MIGAIQGASREKIYDELGFQSLAKTSTRKKIVTLGHLRLLL